MTQELFQFTARNPGRLRCIGVGLLFRPVVPNPDCSGVRARPWERRRRPGPLCEGAELLQLRSKDYGKIPNRPRWRTSIWSAPRSKVGNTFRTRKPLSSRHSHSDTQYVRAHYKYNRINSRLPSRLPRALTESTSRTQALATVRFEHGTAKRSRLLAKALGNALNSIQDERSGVIRSENRFDDGAQFSLCCWKWPFSKALRRPGRRNQSMRSPSVRIRGRCLSVDEAPRSTADRVHVE